MARAIPKVPVTCPGCGHVQPEPPGFLSTICRSCGTSFTRESIAKARPGKPSLERRPSGPPPGLLDLLFKKKPRSIHCYRCGANHEVSGYARSTICPSCAANIDLSPLTVEVQVSREVDIRSHLTIKKTALLNSSRAVCTTAEIAGKFYGNLLCERLLTLSFQGVCQARMTAQRIVVTAAADLATAFPLQAEEVEIRGRVRSNIIATRSVRLRKGATVEGSITTRRLQIDKGAIFTGGMNVGPGQPAPGVIWNFHEEIPKLKVAERQAFLRPGGTI